MNKRWSGESDGDEKQPQILRLPRAFSHLVKGKRSVAQDDNFMVMRTNDSARWRGPANAGEV
ncbi:MAG TPA: hypothetical protein VJX73_09320 [Terracidiphilus sp.]|nr:hypothetical protein [Terracidiphilus sp.]